MEQIKIGSCKFKNLTSSKGIEVTLDFGGHYIFEGKSLNEFINDEGNINEDDLLEFFEIQLRERNRG
jgi:hypothetical protein